MRLGTLLGSCVAITMWHPVRQIGGMCHYLLAERSCNTRLENGFYANEAIALFQKEITMTGTQPHDYEVKIFGGGNMFSNLPGAAGSINVARSNVEAGLKLLAWNGFKIRASDLGGTCHRRVAFDLWSGDVWLNHGDDEQQQRDE